MDLSPSFADRLAELILPSLHREYPNKIAHVMVDDTDARPPRELTCAFYGCFDWHSAVHSHWSIARLARECPGAAWVSRARDALDRSLTAANVEREVEYISAPHRAGFEMPYGVAWLLCLAAELAEHDASWADHLAPLVNLCESRFAAWLERLPFPIRSGQHPQSAFAMGLALDYGRRVGRAELVELVERRAVELYGADVEAPLAYEPSAYDFLSPVLAEADLLARVMEPDRFADWFAAFLPELELAPVSTPDRADGKLVHLDGLNLSRAWMLDRIATVLDREDVRELARAHRDAGLEGVAADHYEGAHWLGTFALYCAL